MNEPRVRILDLARQLAPLREQMLAAAARVLDSGWFLLGRELEEFESAFAGWLGRGHGVGCANGTDAITLSLLAAGIGEGDEVLTLPTTAFATAAGITRAGAIPRFVDVDPGTWLPSAEAFAAACGPRTRAIVAVHLYGQLCDVPALLAAAPGGVLVVEDCAQAHGARLGGRLAGTMSGVSAFSFYPSKNLGAPGDAGMVCCDDAGLASRLRALRFYGQDSRDHHAEVGMNSRLDELHAAFLSVELDVLDGWLARRREIARAYDSGLDPGIFRRPEPIAEADPAYHLYVVRVEDRDGFRAWMDERGIDTGVHYPKLIPDQPAYAARLGDTPPLPESRALAGQIVSLPVAPHLSGREVERVLEACHEWSRSRA